MAIGPVNNTQQYINSAQECTLSRESLKCVQKKKKKKENAKCKRWRKHQIQTLPKCAFGLGLKIKIILLFNLFLLLFMDPTVLFQLI